MQPYTSSSKGYEDDWRLPSPEELKQELLQEFAEEEKAEVWSEAVDSETVKTYYEELVVRWKEEIDTLLVYAALFSAVLAAFNVESYQLLQPSSTDATLVVLQQISAQLKGFSISPPFVNSTNSAHTGMDVKINFNAPWSMVWLNTLWFSSLVCSLGSASIALLVKQWLHEARDGLSGTSRECARLRQHRLNGLLKWRVDIIVAALPILLQTC
ncbi:hypothetical protein C8Q76DRAFT_725828 [Earliella scabrosa]|nr:hypothetical protein C8Q76DRAFT_725828 [Earliella scabrosa]